jgi:hypothetical protein
MGGREGDFGFNNGSGGDGSSSSTDGFHNGSRFLFSCDGLGFGGGDGRFDSRLGFSW